MHLTTPYYNDMPWKQSFVKIPLKKELSWPKYQSYKQDIVIEIANYPWYLKQCLDIILNKTSVKNYGNSNIKFSDDVSAAISL